MAWLFEGVIRLLWELVLNCIIYNTGVAILRLVSLGYWDFDWFPLGVTDFDYGRGALWPFLVAIVFYGLIFFTFFL